jgi:proteasome lid subunit RPN8/RPN11
MKNRIKNFIKNHAIETFPEECCGLIIKDKKEVKCIKMKNIAKEKECFFKISVLDFLNISNKILYIYHSHTIDNNEFSPLDIKCSKYHNINMILYNIKQNKFNYFRCK